jgi:uncharacterized protein
MQHMWIPMRDGMRLSAWVWVASVGAAPAIVEYHPYRVLGGSELHDRATYEWFAAKGFAGVRVDIRGMGDSDGVFDDEYSETERLDAAEVVAWVAEQPWCSGAVGMIGYSWGGIAALQAASLRPPALRAIVTVDSTDDRFARDVHYSGGCVLASDMLSWATTLLAQAARPPDPAIVGDGWRTQWHQRVAALSPPIVTWLSHQTEDEYWRAGSVVADPAAIECAVLAVGGWHDGYRSTVFQLLEQLQCPVEAIVGPWAHGYPDVAMPGPNIDFREVCREFFERWMSPSVVEDAAAPPALRAYLIDHAAEPAPRLAGRWVADGRWSAEADEPDVLHLGAEGLTAEAPPVRTTTSLTDDVTITMAAGAWCGHGLSWSIPGDQADDDRGSACFDSTPLERPLVLLGRAQVQLAVRCRPPAQVIVRLCAVGPDGSSRLIARGIERIVASTAELVVRLDAAGVIIPVGHRLRLAITSTYWPFVWPESHASAVQIDSGRVELPVAERHRADPCSPEPGASEQLVVEVEPDTTAWAAVDWSDPALPDRSITTAGDAVIIRTTPEYALGRWQLPSGYGTEMRGIDELSIDRRDPARASATSRRVVGAFSAAHDVVVEATATMRDDGDGHFVVEASLRAYERVSEESPLTTSDGDVPIERSWRTTIARM